MEKVIIKVRKRKSVPNKEADEEAQNQNAYLNDEPTCTRLKNEVAGAAGSRAERKPLFGLEHLKSVSSNGKDRSLDN